MARKMKSMDGNNAAAHVSYAFSEVAAIYPITPSSPMADFVDQWSANGLKNIFGTRVKVVEMQSEAGAAGAVHGSLGTGALTTTYTASQGLLLMIPNMYKIAAEQLPCVFHVSARTVSTHALNIFGDHSDVMACRQTGFAMLCEGNVQEVMDLSPVAHLAALTGKVPFINFFDGFRTSHEIQKIAVWDYKDLAEMCDMDAVKAFREHALNPEHPHMRGSHENGDTFFQHREACNPAYEALPAVVEKYMAKINEKLGTNYDLFNYYGAPDADRVMIAMGSVCDVADEVIDYLNAKGEKVGIVKVRLYRPWVSSALLKVLPKTAKKVAVLDRTKEPGSLGEPLYLDVAATLREAGLNDVVLTGGRYGLGSKDTPPSSVFAVYEELAKEVMAICAEYKVPCILHTFWRVAEKLKCDTVHLPLPILRQFVLEKQNQTNQKYRESQNLSIPESQREIIQKIGTSVHSTEQAQEAQELGASYVTAGHIYATDCKKGLQPRGLDFLRQVCAAVDLPVYAIGGIKFDETQWMSLKECGAAGGCIMSGMMKA